MIFTQAITFKRLQDISVNSANVFFTATFNLLVCLSAGNSWWKHTGIISKKQPAFHLFRTRFAVFNIFFFHGISPNCLLLNTCRSSCLSWICLLQQKTEAIWFVMIRKVSFVPFHWGFRQILYNSVLSVWVVNSYI